MIKNNGHNTVPRISLLSVVLLHYCDGIKVLDKKINKVTFYYETSDIYRLLLFVHCCNLGIFDSLELLVKEDASEALRFIQTSPHVVYFSVYISQLVVDLI